MIFDSVPLTATGKIDKKALRARHHTVLASEEDQKLDQHGSWILWVSREADITTDASARRGLCCPELAPPA